MVEEEYGGGGGGGLPTDDMGLCLSQEGRAGAVTCP